MSLLKPDRPNFVCSNCNAGIAFSWSLAKYFGISGRFCSDCYDLVSHNSYGKPNNPDAYQAIFDKQTLAKISERLKK
jgi:hypothetical protein